MVLKCVRESVSETEVFIQKQDVIILVLSVLLVLDPKLHWEAGARCGQREVSRAAAALRAG